MISNKNVCGKSLKNILAIIIAADAELIGKQEKRCFEPYMVAQVVEAFHGDCVIAYNEKKAYGLMIKGMYLSLQITFMLNILFFVFLDKSYIRLQKFLLEKEMIEHL